MSEGEHKEEQATHIGEGGSTSIKTTRKSGASGDIGHEGKVKIEELLHNIGQKIKDEKKKEGQDDKNK